ncbi:lachesin-like [Phymastichus coffea]|uniref:lachesin-like n=1 Tax=Phymastichus coffea TaxID=108790 RepID=UPI00273C0904|nr:lachesin-like [Phymastichus coffea]
MPPTGAVWLRPTLLLRCALAALCVAAPRRAEEAPPLFEQTASRVSGFEGQTVYLPCRVRNLGDRLVSWMRGRDLHILSSGELSFSSDARFRLQHPAGSDAWTLRLERLRGSDAGAYECQVNSEPKAMRRVQLSVRDSPPPPPVDSQDEPSPQRSGVGQAPEPRAAIAGPRERRVQRGSSVSLRCLVSAPRRERPVEAVQWLRDARPRSPT